MLLVWYLLVAIMLTAYVVLDGFDLGVGVLHLFLARTDEEKSLADPHHRASVGRE